MEFKIDEVVITTKNKVGIIKEIDIEQDRVLLKIGNRTHYVYINQIFKIQDVVNVNVTYMVSMFNKIYNDSMIISIPKDTELYSECNALSNYCKTFIQNTVNQEVKIKSIKFV